MSMPPEPPRPTGVYLPLRGPLLAVKTTFTVIIVMAVVAIAADVFHLKVLVRADRGVPVSASTADLSSVAQGLTWTLQIAALIAGAIAFIVWLARAYGTLDAVAPGVRRYATVWAGIGWFVPIWAYFRPVQVVNDVRRAGGGGLAGLVAVWWALWLLERSWGLVTSFGGVNAEETGTQIGQMYMVTIDDALVVAAATLALFVAVRLSDQLELQASVVAHRHQAGDAWRFDREVAEGDRRPAGELKPAAGE
jgi:hypothetical protein